MRCPDPVTEPEPTHPPIAPLPVVLVHGILGQELVYWNLLRARLKASGFDIHEISLPNLALGDLRAAAGSFDARLRELRDLLGVDQVDIVAHSAGGLVLRHYLKFLATTHDVRRVVMLGTPHEGTTSTRFLPEVGMIAQVRPGSAFLSQLNDADPTPEPTLYTTMWTPYDGVVLPAASARLPLAANVENVCYHGITHWGYLFGPRLAKALAHELRVGFQGGERVIGRTDSFQ